MTNKIRFDKDARTNECPLDRYGSVAASVCRNCIYHLASEGFVVTCDYTPEEDSMADYMEAEDDDD